MLKLLLTSAALIYIVLNVHPSELYNTLIAGDRSLVLIAVILVIPNIGLQFLKWNYLVKILKPEISISEVGGSLFAGFTTGIITPARIGEFAGRAMYLRDVNKMTAVGLTVIDKLMSLVITIVAGMAGGGYILLRFNYLSPYFWIPFALLFITFMYVCMWLITHPPFVWKIIKLFPTESKTHRRVVALFDSFKLLRTKHVVVLLTLSAAFYTTFFLQYQFLIAAFERVGVIESASAVAMTLFAKTVIPPITLGELGIREGAAIYFLSLFGYAATSAVNASLIIFSCNILLPSLIGLFFLPRISFSSLGR